MRSAILDILSKAVEALNGYQVIQAISERTEGQWKPSPGSVYPTISQLEDEGLIRGEESEGKRRFTLTEEGTAAQREKAGEESPWDAVRADAAPEQIQLAESMKKLHHAIRQAFVAGDDGQQKRVRELLDETRGKIYAILAEED